MISVHSPVAASVTSAAAASRAVASEFGQPESTLKLELCQALRMRADSAGGRRPHDLPVPQLEERRRGPEPQSVRVHALWLSCGSGWC